MLLWSNETIHCNSVLHCNCNYLKIICRKLIFAHLSRIVSNKILRVFFTWNFFAKKVCYLESFCLFRPCRGNRSVKTISHFSGGMAPLICATCGASPADYWSLLGCQVKGRGWSVSARNNTFSVLVFWLQKTLECTFIVMFLPFLWDELINILLKMIWLRDGIICLSREQCTFQGDERDSISDEFYHQEIKECSLV